MAKSIFFLVVGLVFLFMMKDTALAQNNSNLTCSALDIVMNANISYTGDADSMAPFDFGTVATYSCDTGFFLQGSANRTCTGDGNSTNGTFDGSAPTCVAITCSALDIVINANINYTGDADGMALFDFGTVATYSCDTGFILQGNANRTCTGDGSTANGTFDGSTPTCVAITCSALEVVMNGNISYTEDADDMAPFDIGTVVTYSCDTGFFLQGSANRTCTGDGNSTNGTFDGSPPTCVAITCSALDMEMNANISYTADADGMAPFDFGTVATHSCDTGFFLQDSANRTCTGDGISANGTFDGSAPTCVAITCSALDMVMNANISYTGDADGMAPFDFGTVATHSCDTGFFLQGSANRTCTGDGISANGTFDGSAPTCVAITCSALDMVMNTNISYTGDADGMAPFDFGTVATHSCDTGFFLQGSANRTCTGDGISANGTFDGSAPTCVAITCSALDMVMNANISYTGDADGMAPFDFGTVATHSCDTGFFLQGSANRTCTGDGISANGTFDGSAPTCVAITCSALDMVMNTNISYTGDADGMAPFDFGTVATHSCDTGFFLQGSANRTCTGDGISANGTFDGSAPTCVAITCSALDMVMNANISYTGDADGMAPFDFGTVATHSCDTGYFLQGSANRTCTGDGISANGTFDGSAPTCVAITCSALDIVMNANINYTADADGMALFAFGTVATHSCDTGFFLQGSANRTCTGDGISANGTFDGSAPTCVAITCSALDMVMNTNISYTGDADGMAPFDFGTVATHSCDTGFFLQSSANRTCTGDGISANRTFDGSAPTCVAITCSALDMVMNANITYIGDADGMAPFDFGTVATYSCDTGFFLQGSTNETCTGDGSSANGTFDGLAPSCVAITCSALDMVMNANITYMGDADGMAPFDFGTVATYSCDTGFLLQGSTNDTCTGDGSSAIGTFDGLVPICVVSPTIGFETNESRLREGDAVEVCLFVESGEVTSFILIIIAIFTGNGERNRTFPDEAIAVRDYNTNPQTDPFLDEILLALYPGDQRVCFQVLSVNNSIPDSIIRQTTFWFYTNTTIITSPISSHQLYILDDDVNCTQQVSVESRLCVDLENLSVTCLEPALVCDYLVINCPDMSDELNCPSPLDGLVNSTVNEDNLGMTVSQVSTFANVSANGNLLQTEDFLSDISTVFENVANLVNSSNITVNPTVVSEIVSTLNSLLRWNPDSLVVNSTSSLVQSFEVVASIFAQQDNLTVDFVDVSFVAELAPTDNFRASGSSVDFESQVGSPTSIVLPPSTFNLVPEDQPFVGVFFALYQASSLFPITSPPRADNTTTRMRAVGSVVVAATVGPGLTLINIDPPVLITVGLQNPENISQGSESCVSWDFNSQSWVTEGCSTMRVGNNVECRCDHLTNFAVLVDICSRAQDCVSDPTVDTVLEGITLIGVVISCVGLIITIITLLAFRKVREKDNSKYHIQLSIAILCLLIVFAAGIDKVQVYGGCIVVSILIHYFSLVAVMWMGAEALLMFQKLVIVFIQITKTYIVILSLVCWLVPLIPVLIPMIVDLADGTTPETDLIITRNMDNETGNITGFCFLKHPGVFFGTFLGPIFAIILFNVVVFIWVIVILIKHTRRQLKRSDQAVKTKTVIRLVISISGVMFLFGLTWLFGALTFSIAGNNILRDVFRALFVVFASFQGFFIFLFFCVFNTEAREHWKEVLSCGKYRSQSLHPSQYKTPSGVISNNKAHTLTTGASSTLGGTTYQSDTLQMSVFDSRGYPLALNKEV